MIRRRRPRHAFAMALMLVVLMVLTVITVTLVGTGVRDQQSARLSAGRSEARLLAASVFEDFFSRLKEDPTGLYDLLGSNATDGLAGSVFAGYNTAFRRTTAPKWAVLPSIGRTSQTAVPGAVGTTACAVDDFTQDCFHVEIPTEDRLGPVNAPGSFLLRVNMRLRCGGVEARCIYSSFEQRVRRVQFYDFALAQEFTTLAPSALFAPGSYPDPTNPQHVNATAYNDYVAKCVKRASLRDRTTSFSVSTGTTDFASGTFAGDGFTPLVLTGCADIAYTADSAPGGLKDRLGSASIYSKDDWVSVCGAPDISRVFLSGPGRAAGAQASWSGGMTGFANQTGCPDRALDGRNEPEVRELNVPVLSLPSGTDVLAAATASGGTVTAITPGSPRVIDLNTTSGLLALRGDNNPATLDAVIFGQVTGNVSVVVQGSVAIIGDITYQGGKNGNDALSLTASERIEIWQSCWEASGPHPDRARLLEFPSWNTEKSCVEADPFDRTVHGVLTSPEGYIGVPDWLTNADYPTAPFPRDQKTLYFYGSMTSKFQGVFGGFDAEDKSATLVSGFFKNFEHDERLTKVTNGSGTLTLPPYLVESSTPVWVRLDLSEVGYQGS